MKKTGFQIRRLQEGENPEDWKPMSIVGSGVRELRISTSDGVFRTIYYANFEEAVYILHAFQKKTKKTPLQDVELGRKRFNNLIRNRDHD